MEHILTNERFEAIFSEHGGELISFTDTDSKINYIWNGDDRYWKYHSPTLFPIIGSLNNDKYHIGDNEYSLKQHGLARLQKFTCYEKTYDSITFQLRYNEETLTIYPFKFVLRIKYTLEKNKLNVKYIIENIDNKPLHFQIGGHPAFNIPFTPNSCYEDYYFKFEQNETVSRMLLDENNLISPETINYLNNKKIIPITTELFREGALIFSNLKSNYVTLASEKEAYKIHFHFQQFPILAFWALDGEAPFICIEPWHGHADISGFTGELKDKAGIITINKKENFQCEYAIEISK